MHFLKKIFAKKTPSPDVNPNLVNEELSDGLDEVIKAFCAKGDALADKKEFKEAIQEYNNAWEIIPEPKSNWDASLWVLIAIADASYLGGFKTTARQALEDALSSCSGAIGNPFVHLRYGQVLFDADEKDRAADELMRAYMGDGTNIFKGEDKKYFNFLKTRADGIN